jgi:transcriptional regulator with XRE-family HTH domain
MAVRVRTQKRRRPHYIAAWRKRAKLTQYQLAELVGTNPGNLSRVETGRQPYTQDLLEAVAAVLKIAPAALIAQDPHDPTGIWEIWDKASRTQREQIADLARVVTKGTAVA